MSHPAEIALVIELLPFVWSGLGALILVDLPVDVVIVLEQQERAHQL
jgi:hypothetical protein